MKFKKYLMIAAALALVSLASVKTTMAYFTDSKEATGGVTLSLGDSRLTPHETVDGLVKHITVENTGNYDVFIRVKAVYGSNYDASVVDKTSAGWQLKDDGYYYYKDVVKAHETAPELQLQIKVKDNTAVENSFNVVIIQEATLAIYDGDNVSADWTKTVMSCSDYDAKFSNQGNEPAAQQSQSTDTDNGQGEGDN